MSLRASEGCPGYWIITEAHRFEDDRTLRPTGLRGGSNATEGKVVPWKQFKKRDYGLAGKM